MPETAETVTPQTTSRTMVFLQWDRRGFMVGKTEFPAGYSCALIARWRERVASNGGWTVEAGVPRP